MNNDPAAPQVPAAAGSNNSDKELTDAALAAASVNPQPATDAPAPVEQLVADTAQPSVSYPEPSADAVEADVAPEIDSTPAEVTPVSDPSIEPATAPVASNPMPAIPVNDNTIAPSESTVTETPQPTTSEGPEAAQPTPGAFGTDTAPQTQQTQPKPEGFMDKLLGLFKKK